MFESVLLPGSWHDDGAPWRLHQGCGPLRRELLRVEPRGVEGHGSTAAAAVGGHLPILPRLREAGPTKVINIHTFQNDFVQRLAKAHFEK